MPVGRPRSTPALQLPHPPPRRDVVRTMSEPETSLLDVIDSLLNKGVVLNADVILALADVDLVYLRLSALLCAADRVQPARTTQRRRSERSRATRTVR
jgi:hypothetical protein